jgi:hypothetical protein
MAFLTTMAIQSMLYTDRLNHVIIIVPSPKWTGEMIGSSAHHPSKQCVSTHTTTMRKYYRVFDRAMPRGGKRYRSRVHETDRPNR